MKGNEAGLIYKILLITFRPNVFSGNTDIENVGLGLFPVP